MLTSRQIRQQYIDFFVQKHAHTFVASSPVVPHDDPTLLFTNAGMNQFKPFFLGSAQAPWNRVANTQKCIRAGGKHNDLDDVGRSRRHHTFFEMLGNWSFGNYFKQGAIEMAWELLTKVWNLDPRRLHVSCYEGNQAAGVPRDTEAADIWRKLANWDQYPGHTSDAHIHYFGKDNFWEMGDTGPCGPCTEIYIDRTPDMTGGPEVNGNDPRVMEIWNLVFIQYNRDASGALSVLPSQHVDTGMGFERISQVLQGVDSNFGIDLWLPIFAELSKLSGKQYTGLFPKTNSIDPVAEAANPQLRTDIAFRVIADHLRCLTFALTDGATPSNDGRGSVLRRILRRAYRFGRQQLGMTGPFIHKLVPALVAEMGDSFPELKAKSDAVIAIIKDEEESFERTLDRGIALFDEAATAAINAGSKVVPGSDAFKLHDTFGFPIDLTRVMAEERGMTVDIPGYEKLMAQAKEVARSGGGPADASASLTELVTKESLAGTKFTGYKETETANLSTSVRLYKLVENQYTPASSAAQGDKVAIVLDSTPFYGESGGQVGDTGAIHLPNGRVVIQDTVKVGDVFFHMGTVEAGTVLAKSTPVTVAVGVERGRREKIASNHTSTHVMNHKLRAVLGDHIQQKGSLVDEHKLRFDFSHNAPLSADEVAKVEALVNEDIKADLKVHTEFSPQEEALKIHGLRAVFGEKYPPSVRVVSIGASLKELLGNPANTDWYNKSVEFCGGTHLPSTGAAQDFVIASEEPVSKGVRRITALTGIDAAKARSHAKKVIDRLERLKHVGPDDLGAALQEATQEAQSHTLPASAKPQVAALIAHHQGVLKEHEKTKSKAAAGAAVDVARTIAQESSGNVIVAEIPGADTNALRSAMDVIKAKQPQAGVLLAGVADGKIAFVASVPQPLIAKGLKAGDWVRETAKVAGGKGGGKPDMAQAGAPDAAKLSEALAQAKAYATPLAG